MNLTGKTALVTGAGRGIGNGCALELARRGAAVVLNDRVGSPDLAGAVAEIGRMGGEAHGIEADVFSRAGCESLLARARERAGALDILISNPALGDRQSFLDYDPGAFEAVLRATLTAGFHMSQLAARQMVERGEGGKIVFISSVHGELAMRNALAYNAAKAGLNHMAISIARELMPHRINVNVIAPGWVDTPGEHETFGAAYLEEQGRLLPWGRLGSPADIGNAAAFLASDEADYITGVVLRVDGGYAHKDH